MGLQGLEMTQSFDDDLVHKTVAELFDMVKSKQSEIDNLEVEIKETQAFLNNQNHIKQTSKTH